MPPPSLTPSLPVCYAARPGSLSQDNSLHISQRLRLTHVDNVRRVEERQKRQRKLQRCLGYCPIGQQAFLLRKDAVPIGKTGRPTTQTRAAHVRRRERGRAGTQQHTRAPIFAVIQGKGCLGCCVEWWGTSVHQPGTRRRADMGGRNRCCQVRQFEMGALFSLSRLPSFFSLRIYLLKFKAVRYTRLIPCHLKKTQIYQ